MVCTKTYLYYNADGLIHIHCLLYVMGAQEI